MREKINKLARGIIDDSTPLVCVEPGSIEYELTPGVAVRFVVHLSSKNDVYIKGLAYSSDDRVKVVNASFGGPSVNLYIDAMMRIRDEDDDIDGVITLVTNGGESEIPFHFHKQHVTEDDAVACLNTVEDFSLILDNDGDTAFRIFENRNFINAPFMSDLKRKVLYTALKKNPDRKIAFEQFLIGIGLRGVASGSLKTAEDTGTFNPDRINVNSNDSENGFDEINLDSLPQERNLFFKKNYFKYAQLRLSYEMDRGNTMDEISMMSDCLEKIADYQKHKELITLLRAEVEYLKRDTKAAAALINSVSQTIREDRQQFLREYFLLEYLEIVALKKFEKTASFIRLCKKFIEEEKMHELFYYVLKLDDELVQNDSRLHGFLCDVYNAGSRSPFLYYNNCLLLNDHPEYLYAPKSLDTKTLHFGSKYKLLNEDIHSAVVSATCISFIKADRKTVSCHKYYAEGIQLNLSINGLYEYYMYSLPNDDEYHIMDQVLEHYAGSDSLDLNTRMRLYSNVVKYKNKNSGIYRSYEERITGFAFKQLENNVINPYMAEIYKAVIKPDMVNSDNAEAVYNLASSYYIKSDDMKYRNVVILYTLTNREYIYKTTTGNVVAPIFDNEAIILFQDVFGNRFVDVNFSLNQLINQSTLRNAAIKTGAGNNMIKLIKVKDLISKKNINIDDVQILEDAVYNPVLNDAAKAIVINKLIHYYNQHTASGYNPDFLFKINKNNLSNSERQDLTNAYITCGCYQEAYEMIKVFGYSGVTVKNIKTLCSKMILEKMFTEEKLLLSLSELTVEQRNYDAVILDYLCEHYNGPSEKMFDILKRAIEADCNTYDMEERLLAQEIFTGENEHIDQVFNWYISRKKTSDSIVKAYFTIKTVNYFFDDVAISPKLIEYLENAAADANKLSNIPVIYMLALTRYYSKMSDLSVQQIDISKKFVYYLCEKKLMFPYFKKFADYFELPENIVNSKIVIYKCTPGSKPWFRSQVIPTEEEKSTETGIASFMNLLIYSKELFSGEQWQYEIFENENGEDVLTNSGLIKAGEKTPVGHSLMYDSINEICKLVSTNKDIDAISKMEEYITMKDSIKTLFKN